MFQRAQRGRAFARAVIGVRITQPCEQLTAA